MEVYLEPPYPIIIRGWKGRGHIMSQLYKEVEFMAKTDNKFN